MFDPVSALIMGGSALLGGVLANNANSQNVASANAASKESVDAQMAFQERMSNTAYQRARDDLQAAGLNRILAYSQGPASAPSGASYTAQAARHENVIAPAVTAGVDALSKTQAINQAREGLGLQARGVGVQEATSKADIALKAAQAAASVSSAKKTELEAQVISSRAKREKLEGDFYDSDMGKSYFYLDKINQAAGGSLDTLNSATSLINPFSKAKKLFQPQSKQRLPKNGVIRKEDADKYDLDSGSGYFLKP